MQQQMIIQILVVIAGPVIVRVIVIVVTAVIVIAMMKKGNILIQLVNHQEDNHMDPYYHPKGHHHPTSLNKLKRTTTCKRLFNIKPLLLPQRLFRRNKSYSFFDLPLVDRMTLSSTVLWCGTDKDRSTLFLSEKGELFKFKLSYRDGDEPDVEKALFNSENIVDVVLQFNTDRVVVITDEGAVYIM